MIKNKFKKLVVLVMSFALMVNNMFFGVVFALAQEADPSATTTPIETEQVVPTESPAAEATTSPTVDPVVTASPEPTPSPESVVVPTATPIPTPSPTPAPLTEEQQQAIHASNKKAESERDAREEEWENHEEDEDWIAAHGGNRDYYISGGWHQEQEAKRQEELKKAAEVESTQAISGSESTPEDVLATPDPFATNTCSESNNALVAETSVENNNCLVADNNSNAAGVSGENTQSSNEGDVTMTTGNSGAQGTLANKGNVNTTDTSNPTVSGNNQNIANTNAEDQSQSNVVDNVSTGEDTSNLSSGSDSQNLAVDNTNNGFVHNELNVEATSGSNTVTDNDGDATLTTGDIELIANLLNILNVNITGDDFMHLIVNIFGTLNGDVDIDNIAQYLGMNDEDQLEVIARNEDTGDDSENTAIAESSKDTSINNNNDAHVVNDVNVKGTSGANDVSGNDGEVNIVTGRIKLLANIMNFINSNFSGEKWKFIMVNIFGSLNGNLILPATDNFLTQETDSVVAENTNTGDGSTNYAEATKTDTTLVNNTNDVTLKNNVNGQGITGQNEQSNNDDANGHTVNTGETNVLTQLMNYLNFNITGNNWVLLIVNVFGKWMGQIVGFADGAPMSAPANGTLAALATSNSGVTGDSVAAINNGTGEDSNNTAIATQSSSLDVNNNNGAYVENNVNLEGISGQNTANKNDGSTSITTGWVELTANLLNIINFNATGKNWMLVFLNIFGDFNGNLYFGAPPIPVVSSNEEKAIGGISNTNNNTNSESQAQNNSSSSNSNNSQQSQSLQSAVKAAKAARRIRLVKRTPYLKKVARNNNSYYATAKENSTTEVIAKELTVWDKISNLFSSIYLKFNNLISPIVTNLTKVNHLSLR